MEKGFGWIQQLLSRLKFVIQRFFHDLDGIIQYLSLIPALPSAQSLKFHQHF